MSKTPEERLSEIQLYELVANELEQGEKSKGVWVKALSESEGDTEKAKGLYIRLRVEMIKDEWAYAERTLTREREFKKRAEQSKEEEIRGHRRWSWLFILVPILAVVLYSNL